MEKQKILVIAEKPSVGRDYARVLKCTQKGEGCLIGDDYIVSWAIGHLIELAPPDKYDERYAKWNYNDLPIIPEEIKLEVIRGSGPQFKILKKLMNSKEVSRIICGTDSGREGELIFRYIYHVAGCKKPFDRLWVSSMTDEAIKKGFADLKDGHEYDTLYDSAKCRSEADWLVGINGSRAFTIRYDTLLSIGRVQTPTLSIIVKRQKEIDAFIPQDYYEVKLTHPAGIHTESDPEFTSTYFLPKDKQKETHIPEETEAKRIRENAVKRKEAAVREITTTPGRQLPPLLYDLTELQRDANRRFGYSANKTLNIAQSLYEKHKYLTYPRTDSRYLPDDMKDTVRQTLHQINIPEFHDMLMGIPGLNFNKRIIDNSKITDHHAIIPTNKKPDLSKLTTEEANIYRMVVQRLIEVFYPAYEYDTTEIILAVEDPESEGGEDLFLAKGRTVKQLGFMALRKGGKEEGDPPLPVLTAQEKVEIASGKVHAKKTQPPKPFTEATLLTAMEYAGKYIEDEELKEEMDKLSLGTPATRASIIERLIQVKYIRREKKALVPTEKGKSLIEIVPPELKSPEMTGKWERSLDKIYQGNMEPQRFMGSIYRYVSYIVGSAATRTDVVFEKEERKSKYKKKSASGTGNADAKGKNTAKGEEGNEQSAVSQNNAGRSASLGVCPMCKKGGIYRNSKAYYCSDWKKGCKFTVWIDALDRHGAHLSDEMITRLSQGETMNLPMTKPQTGEKGQADVVFENGKLEVKNFRLG